MLSIGDFSKLSRVSVKTLRFYDEIDLFKALEVDQCTGYRHYSADQLPRLNRILALKDLGFSLEQIAHILNDGISLAELRGMLRLRQAEIQQRLVQEQEQLARVAARLKQIEREQIMPDYDVIIKNLEPQLVASIREILPRYQDIGRFFAELYSYLQRHGTGGLSAAIYHDEGYKTSDIDAEAVVYLKSRVPETARVRVYELPATRVASVVHHGPYSTLNKAYDAVITWIEANNYKIVAANRELYLHCDDPVRQDDQSYVTEIQFSVVKNS